MDFYKANGTLEQHIEGHDLSAKMLSSVTEARGSEPSALDSLSRVLEQHAQRPFANTERVLQIIDAIRAQTAAEFHQRVRNLPVTLTMSLTRDAQGRQGVEKVYTHVTGRKLVVFTVTNQTDELNPLTGLQDPSDGATENRTVEGELEVQNSTTEGAESSAYDCDYTDDESNYWSGECATEQDIEDATIVALSMDAESEAVVNQEDSEIASYCLSHNEDELCAAQEESGKSFAIGDMTGPNAFGGGGLSCSAAGITFFGTAVNYGYRAWKLWRVINAIDPPAGALGDAVILGGIALAGVSAAGIVLHDCLAQ